MVMHYTIMGPFHGIVRVWDMPPPPIPVSSWFPQFVEAVAGIRLSPRGNVEMVSRLSDQELARHFATSDPSEYYQKVVRWFLAVPTK